MHRITGTRVAIDRHLSSPWETEKYAFQRAEGLKVWNEPNEVKLPTPKQNKLNIDKTNYGHLNLERFN